MWPGYQKGHQDKITVANHRKALKVNSCHHQKLPVFKGPEDLYIKPMLWPLPLKSKGHTLGRPEGKKSRQEESKGMKVTLGGVARSGSCGELWRCYLHWIEWWPHRLTQPEIHRTARHGRVHL